VQVWHGLQQEVGHLGTAQSDFNLLGRIENSQHVESLLVQVNDGPLKSLSWGSGPWGYRRLAGKGHFNADIALHDLHPGKNSVRVQITDKMARTQTVVVNLTKSEGDCPLPATIHWSEVEDPQECVQMVDGHWVLGKKGLRTGHSGYDRLFLLGTTQWRDYEVTVPVTVHKVDRKTGPHSGGNGVGLILRFAGHVTRGHRNFPDEQPKWGYQPFGAICWLRWKPGRPRAAPQKQFYAGYSDRHRDFGPASVLLEHTYFLKARCETLSQRPAGSLQGKRIALMEEREYRAWEDGAQVTRLVGDEQPRGITRYRFKIWPAGKREPKEWDWQVVQVSVHALQKGGVAFVAHHVDVTFGDVNVVSLDGSGDRVARCGSATWSPTLFDSEFRNACPARVESDSRMHF
jgi:hypothetical protein